MYSIFINLFNQDLRQDWSLTGDGMQRPGLLLEWDLEPIWLLTAFILWNLLVDSGEFYVEP